MRRWASTRPTGCRRRSHFPTLAPFWADVDTSGQGSGLVTYGATQYNGDAAFCVLWPMVGYYDSHTDKRNDFQLLIVDRQDTGTDNFDFYFNYNQIQWETGDDSGGSDGLGGDCARAGYTNGTGKSGEHYEVAGSGICGALLDKNSSTGLTQSSLNSSTKGQFIFQVRSGLVSAAGGCLNLTSCFSGAGAAGLAVGGAALVTFVGLGGVGAVRSAQISGTRARPAWSGCGGRTRRDRWPRRDRRAGPRRWGRRSSATTTALASPGGGRRQAFRGRRDGARAGHPERRGASRARGDG